MGLESSSEDKYEEPSSEEENENVAVKDVDGPVKDSAPVDYGFDGDFIGDSNFTLINRRDNYLFKGLCAGVAELCRLLSPRAVPSRVVKFGFTGDICCILAAGSIE